MSLVFTIIQHGLLTHLLTFTFAQIRETGIAHVIMLFHGIEEESQASCFLNFFSDTQ